MAKKNRLSKKVLQDDQDAYEALLKMTGYNPSNTDFTIDKITAANTTMTASQTDEYAKQDALDAAKDIASANEHARHALLLGAKTQVKAQFGENSNEYQSLGMKKKEEYKVGRRTKTVDESA